MRTLRSLAALTFVVAGVTACSGGSEITVVVNHPALDGVTLVDLGEPGPSIGDMRLVSLDATTDGGEPVRADFELLTVDLTEEMEVRSVTGTFVFGDGADQLVLIGSADYPVDAPTIGQGSAIRRSLVGGSGRYAGATGWVETTHLEDGSWTHEFHIVLP